MTKKQFVQIKGTKDGFILHLDDQCSYSELLEGISVKLEEGGIDDKIDAQLQLGKRYCTVEQKKELISLIQSTDKIIVSKVMSDVLTIDEYSKKLEEQSNDTYVGIVRSGQVLHSKGNILVIGDVNPNAKVTAVGSIYILGKLKGIVHAGIEGNEEAIVSAASFEATHVSIADRMEIRSNEQEIIHKYDGQLFAYLDETKKIVYARIQDVRNIRPSLSVFKGGS